MRFLHDQIYQGTSWIKYFGPKARVSLVWALDEGGSTMSGPQGPAILTICCGVTFELQAQSTRAMRNQLVWGMELYLTVGDQTRVLFLGLGL